MKRAFKRYGSEMKIEGNGEAQSFFGFLQPLRYKNKMYLGSVATALGYDNSRKFMLITLPEIDASICDGFEFSLVFEGETFSCDHREVEYISGKAVYAWAVVTKTGRKEESDAEQRDNQRTD